MVRISTKYHVDKSLLPAFFTFLFTVIFAWQFTVSQAHATTKSTPKLLALGDSLTAGYGLPPGDGFADKLQEALLQKGHDVIVLNGGVSGDTTKGGLARLDWMLAERPDLAMIALGGNDLLRGLSPEQSYDNLKAILQRFQDEAIPVLLAGMRAPLNMGAEFQQAFDGLYVKLADEFDVIFFPFFLQDVALVNDLNQPDGLHPNQAGVDVMVNNILPYVEQLVKKSQ